jgi:phospholipid/cholesterol/gamma-HCH transport system substrate-binding protein
MSARTQNIKLGIFVVATTLVFLLVLVFVANLRPWKSEHVYHVVTEQSVAGLEVGSPVTMRGVDVGRIERIELDPRTFDRVRVDLAIDGDVPIPRDAKAMIQFSGLTGLKVIDIAEGSTQAGILPPGSEIPVGETMLAMLETRAEALAETADEIMESTRALLENLVEITDAVSEGINAERIAGVVDRVDEVLRTLASASHQIDATIVESRASLREVFEDVEIASARLEELLQRGTRMVEANDGDVRAAIRDFREAARNLEALARQVRRSPSLLLRSRPPKARELP